MAPRWRRDCRARVSQYPLLLEKAGACFGLFYVCIWTACFCIDPPMDLSRNCAAPRSHFSRQIFRQPSAARQWFALAKHDWLWLIRRDRNARKPRGLTSIIWHRRSVGTVLRCSFPLWHCRARASPTPQIDKAALEASQAAVQPRPAPQTGLTYAQQPCLMRVKRGAGGVAVTCAATGFQLGKQPEKLGFASVRHG